MLINHTPSVNYWSIKSDEKIPMTKLIRKYNANINNSKQSMHSNSKSRSSAKASNKDFNRLITKSKLRLSGHTAHPESATSKYTTIASDIKIQRLEEANIILNNEKEYLTKENMSLREKLNLYINFDIGQLMNQFPRLAEHCETMEELYSNAINDLIKERDSCKHVFEEYTVLTREKEKDIMNSEMNLNYLETKNSLLKEVLTKRNKDMDEIEKGNKQLISILEKYDTKMDKMREQIEVKRLKIEKYEEQTTGKINKIDIDTIDGRINFLVDILEDYKRQLEEMEDEEEESEDEQDDAVSKLVSESKYDNEKEELKKLRNILGAKEDSEQISEQEIPLSDE
jgi:hypothetical protein